VELNAVYFGSSFKVGQWLVGLRVF